MAKGQDGSVAPKERINISFKPAGGDLNEEVELPLKVLVLGEFEGENAPDYKEGKTLSIDKHNFSETIESLGVKLNYRVDNKVVDSDEELSLDVDLDIKSMRDFSPDSVMQNTPALKKILELKQALMALKGPLGNTPAMRNEIKAIFADAERKSKLRKELNLVEDKSKED
jgi:type VI secretion system protein ImpB